MKDVKQMTRAQLREHDLMEKFSGKFDLDSMSLDDIANWYVQVENRSQLIKGKLLLEARKRLPSNLEFSKWVDENDLAQESQQVRWDYMTLAEYYWGRDMSGLKYSICLEIAKLAKEGFVTEAGEVHNYCAYKNLTKLYVKDYIYRLKESRGLLGIKPTKRDIPAPVYNVTHEYVTPPPLVEYTDQPIEPIPHKITPSKVTQISENVSLVEEVTEEVDLIIDLIKDKPVETQQEILMMCADKLRIKLL